ncbi:unnamed protein product [Gongylonema pulchrum]|uniref:Uncharacterized protein n=1 Tax=Gongylonema pulchrum TaxID=637853 RepID=A0A3P7NRN9_9BILA|nr:unnamed protein product [Gongylonema pulchrum]
MEFKTRLSRIGGTSSIEIRGYGALLTELSQELQAMRDDFSTRAFEVARSHTPTITELHSDSGSTQSAAPAHRHSYTRTTGSEPRRLSSCTVTKLSRITPSTLYKGIFKYLRNKSVYSPHEDWIFLLESRCCSKTATCLLEQLVGIHPILGPVICYFTSHLSAVWS